MKGVRGYKMKISKRSLNITPSLTRALFNEATLYDHVIDLTLGDPDFDTPMQIKKAGCNAIMNDKTHYSANAGLIEARSIIADRVEKIWGRACDPEKNLIVTVGGMEALYLALLSIVDEDDEVIIFAPYYVNYAQMVNMCGGKVVVIDSYSSESGMRIDMNELNDCITDRTVAIILNSPNNPTGGILSKTNLKQIADLSDKYNLAIISDEVYRTLIYDGIEHQSILQFEKAKNRTILIDSLSKEYSMTGWRIGYAYAPPEIISVMTKFQENVAACVTVPSQYALIEAYKNDIRADYIRLEFQKRRDCICELLSDIKGISYYRPQGTFYLFVDMSELNIDSEEFAYKLLREKHIAVVPGKAYGESYDKYIRIAFTKNTDILKLAAEKIHDFIDSLNK